MSGGIGAWLDMSVPILVLYPHRGRFYPQHEVYGRLPDYRCTFSAPDEAFALKSRGGMDFHVHRSRPFFGLAPFGAGQLEHAAIVDLDALLRRVKPRVVFTFEAFSAISYQVSRSRERNSFRHFVLSDTTTPPGSSLWRYSPSTTLFAAEVRRSADRFIAHTQLGRNALRQLGVDAERIVVVPPGIDLAAPVEGGPPSGARFRLLFLGALRRNKGLLTLVEAFRTVGRKHPATELAIAGTGPLEPLVAEAARRIPGIRHLGWVGEAAKGALLREADLYVLPSEDEHLLGLARWEEQTAISAIEAMQSGVPTVGSDSGALPEIVGVPEAIFAQRSPISLGGMIERAIEDPRWRLALGDVETGRARAAYDITSAARMLAGALDASLQGS